MRRQVYAKSSDLLALANMARQKILGPPFYRQFPVRALPKLGRGINKRILVCQRPAFVYVRVPKAANSTVQYTLAHSLYHYLEDERALPKKGRKIRRSFFRRPSKLTREAVSGLGKEVTIFIVTRNPYTRILSAYLDKIHNRKRPRCARAIRKRLGLRPNDFPISFRQFCDYLAAGGHHDDPHWAPQSRLCVFPPSFLDYIVHMERLNDELPPVMAAIFGTFAEDGLWNWLPHRTGASGQLASHYDTASQAVVARLYAEDFRRFGYDSARLDGGFA